jgi:hypothetical protein
MNAKYQTDGALLVGPVVAPRDILTGERFGVLPENRERFLDLSKRFRVRSHSDGWFVDGRGHRSQIWEYGIAKLGVTVTGVITVGKLYRIGDWLHRKSIGDAEANFWFDWSDANLERLDALIHLQKRKIGLQSGDTEAESDAPLAEGDEIESGQQAP